MPKEQTLNDHQERILRALVYLQGHLDEDLDRDRLARIACFSPFHFHRIFSAVVGETVKAYIRRLRLERAAIRLQSTRMPAVEVGLEAGYESYESFSRVFRESFGCAPGAYRRSRGFPRVHDPAGVRRRADGSFEFVSPTMGEFFMEVRIEQRPTQRVAFVRHTGPYAEVGPAWETLMAWAGPRGLLGPQTEYFAMSYDDPDITPAEKLRCDVCVVVPPSVSAEGPVGIQEVPAGEYAIVRHLGPFSNLIKTYTWVYAEWLPGSGYECRDLPPLEYYRNYSPTTPEAELITDIFLPVRRA